MSFGGVSGDTVDLRGERRRFLGGLRASAPPATDAQLPYRPVRFVVVETRAMARQPHLEPDEACATVMLPRGALETLEAFSRRATQKVVALERDRQSVRLMLMLLAPRFDERACAARLALVRALMTRASVQPQHSTKLVLCAEDDAGAVVRAGLMTFVGRVMSEPTSWSLPIQVKFGSPTSWT